MTVYVDAAEHSFGRMIMCHMTADTLAELLEAVDRIGVQKKWLQAPPKVHFAHFDISKGKRELAIIDGAQAITSRELVRIAARMTLSEFPQYANDFLRSVAND